MSDYLDDQEQERSVQDIASTIGSSVLPQILNIVSTLRPELVHVFTHVNDNPCRESKHGIFENRRGFFSALSRQSDMNIKPEPEHTPEHIPKHKPEHKPEPGSLP